MHVAYTLFASCVHFILSVDGSSNLSSLSILHFNDFHARYEPITTDSGTCKSTDCIGGFSRLYKTINKAIEENPKTILLNGGDTFEGTLWYDLFKWNVTQFFLNKLPIDANTLGNHEFQDNIEGLVPYLKMLKSPVVCANIDASKEPSLQGLFNKSVIIERDGRKIGVIGVLVQSVGQIANIGKLVMLDESESVNAEAERLVREEGVFTNIVLSHSGYEVEKEIARKATSKISVIVGGHTHTFLYTGENPPGPDIPLGAYPTAIQNADGKTILVVQASSYTKYWGNITVFYDSLGNVANWSGAPIYLDTSLPQDEKISEELKPWKEIVDHDESNAVIGRSLVRIDQSRCFSSECLLGNFITDSMVFGYTTKTPTPTSDLWTRASIAISSASSLRAGIDIGNITYNDIHMAQPFKNTIDLAQIKGTHLKEIFEASAATGTIPELLHVAGLRVKFDLALPLGKRVSSLNVRCHDCKIPIYKPIELEKTYPIAIISFLAEGGMGFDLIPKYLQNRTIGPLDIDLLYDYVQKRSPIYQEMEGRIVINQ